MRIDTKRVYNQPEPSDGYRVLVDRLWPRGQSKKTAAIDLWTRDLAPSTTLRKWFAHEAEKWPEFKRRYFAELGDNADSVRKLAVLAKRRHVTLVYGAKDEQYNNAVALCEYLRRRYRA